MLLVVGLSAVLARFQTASSSAATVVPYHSPLVAYHRSVQDWDRSDKKYGDGTTKASAQDYSAIINQRYYVPASSYTSSYYGQKS